MRKGLRGSLVLKRRFQPPWERDGMTAEAFFSGLMQSSNPVQRARRDQQRAKTAEEEHRLNDTLAPADYERLAEMQRHNEAMLKQQRDFLPYGATALHYFNTTDMAAWGDYQTNVRQMRKSPDGSYSQEMQTILANDMDEKIPYRYSSYVPPDGSGALQWPLHGSVGIVMDIDGVVYRSQKVIPGADAAIQMMRTLRIPFLFMSNGGSMSEADKARELSSLLGCTIDPSQVLLGHSPMRLLAPLYRTDPVVVVGKPACAAIAKEYGFGNVMSVLQYQAEHPDTLPFKKWGDLRTARPAEVPFPRVAAVLQMDIPDDPFNDAQTILDLLTAPLGQSGRYVSGVQTIPYYVGADDLLWSTEALLPRLGQGAFREMMSSVYESVTGHGLETIMYGKPRAIAYAYAERRLREVTVAMGWDPSHMRSIFLVGDNIETDILGANAAGGKWTSVHVLSGIGKAPAARRTLAEGDHEHEWLETCVSKTPHYVAPTLDHFFRELLAFPEQAMLQNKSTYFGKPNPVDLKETYNFSS